MVNTTTHQGRIISYDPNTMQVKVFDLETGGFIVFHSSSYLHSWGVPKANSPAKLLLNQYQSSQYFGFTDPSAGVPNDYPAGEVVLPVQDPIAQGPVVFLAGPILGAADWQSEAIKWFQSDERLSHVTVASPRTADMGVNHDFGSQVDWESRWLTRASEFGVILFWLPKEEVHIQDRAYAQTSRWEISEWKERLKGRKAPLAVGIEEGFSGARYMKHRLGQSHPHMEIPSTMEGVLSQAAQYILRRWPKDGGMPDWA